MTALSPLLRFIEHADDPSDRNPRCPPPPPSDALPAARVGYWALRPSLADGPEIPFGCSGARTNSACRAAFGSTATQTAEPAVREESKPRLSNRPDVLPASPVRPGAGATTRGIVGAAPLTVSYDVMRHAVFPTAAALEALELAAPYSRNSLAARLSQTGQMVREHGGSNRASGSANAGYTAWRQRMPLPG